MNKTHPLIGKVSISRCEIEVVRHCNLDFGNWWLQTCVPHLYSIVAGTGSRNPVTLEGIKRVRKMDGWNPDGFPAFTPLSAIHGKGCSIVGLTRSGAVGSWVVWALGG